MVKRLKAYIENEFINISETREIKDLKDELLANLVDKYEFYKENGFTEEKAFVESIKSIGEIDALLAPYRKVHTNNTDSNILNAYERTSLKLKKQNIIAISLVFISVFIWIGLTLLVNFYIGLIVQFIIIIIAIIIFFLSFIDFNQVLNKLKQDFNQEYYLQGNKYLAKTLVSFITISISVVSLPYLLFSSRIQLIMISFVFDLCFFLQILIREHYQNKLKLTAELSLKKDYKYLLVAVNLFLLTLLPYIILNYFIMLIFIIQVFIEFNQFRFNRQIKLLVINKICIVLFFIYGMIFGILNDYYQISLDYVIKFKGFEIHLYILLAIFILILTIVSSIVVLLRINISENKEIEKFRLFALILFFLGFVLVTLLMVVSVEYLALFTSIFILDYYLRNKLKEKLS